MGAHTIICYSFLIISLMNFLSLGHVEATDYTVGDVDGWSTSTNFQAWSEKYNFLVGDVLGEPHDPLLSFMDESYLGLI